MTTKKTALAIVEESNKKLSQLFKAKDFEALSKCYSKDALLMPPNNKSCTTKTSIKKWWENASASGVTSITLKTKNIDVQNSTLIEHGGAILRDEKGKTLDLLKYVVIWKKIGSKWKMHIDIFNSNK